MGAGAVKTAKVSSSIAKRFIGLTSLPEIREVQAARRQLAIERTIPRSVLPASQKFFKNFWAALSPCLIRGWEVHDVDICS
jgi:hypothetical protein